MFWFSHQGENRCCNMFRCNLQLPADMVRAQFMDKLFSMLFIRQNIIKTKPRAYKHFLYAG